MRYLENTLYKGTKGWFNPETFQIYVSGEIKDDLSQEQKQVLNHENLHYLHFTSTTLGLSFIYNTFKELNQICNWKYNPQTNTSINRIYEEVLRINRYKAKLAVPSYYFMKGPRYEDEMGQDHWVVSASVGTFFNTNGQQSDQNFIMHRFVIGNPADQTSLVARLSLGTRYLYEHLIKFIDLMSDIEKDGLEAFKFHIDNAYYGPYLPYSALALICARYNVKSLNAFILSAIISHLALMIPMHWTKKTREIKKYIERYIRDETLKSNYTFRSSHPSVVVEGLLKKAIEKGASGINFLDFFDSTNDYEKLNNYIEEICKEFNFSTKDLFDNYEEELKRFEKLQVHPILGSMKHKILNEMKNNLDIKRTNFGKYIMQPNDTIYKPFVELDNQVIPGNLTSDKEREVLLSLIDQRDEMLRFNFERNIID